LKYFCHRKKLKSIGREDDVETLNRTALRIARQVADESDKIMAASICNTGIYNPDDDKSKEMAKGMLRVSYTRYWRHVPFVT
jgi:methionine synthase I (cobalamin-dependent)